MGQDDSPRSRSNGLGYPVGQDVVATDVHVDEDRNQAILHDGRNRGREGRRRGDDFVPRMKLTRAKLG